MVEDHTGFQAIGEPITLGTGSEVERHLRLDARRFQMPAANYPSDGFEGLFHTLDFDKNIEKSAYASAFVPMRWKSGSDITIIACWLHDNADNGAVVWGIEYMAIKDGETVNGSSTTITQASAGNHTAGELVCTEFTTKILGSNLEADDIVGIRVFRKAADGSDTLAEDARGVALHFHFTQDKLGKTI